ncbi:hypothetical protein BDP27DRAFT_1441722 [Rhodocollybia butyracea]|uniref:Uncharacterized protein n=1 Tax=Rhodocollybia butyracea TaxID=206335 RepID=A0A9P5Q9Y5_9AGAR|nr:hypothetical protein BDP27DRAFT_1441722 [Rhodocollybia butyracea]
MISLLHLDPTAAVIFRIVVVILRTAVVILRTVAVILRTVRYPRMYPNAHTNYDLRRGYPPPPNAFGTPPYPPPPFSRDFTHTGPGNPANIHAPHAPVPPLTGLNPGFNNAHGPSLDTWSYGSTESSSSSNYLSVASTAEYCLPSQQTQDRLVATRLHRYPGYRPSPHTGPSLRSEDIHWRPRLPDFTDRELDVVDCERCPYCKEPVMRSNLPDHKDICHRPPTVNSETLDPTS